MEFVSKTYEELTKRELYEILKARAEIFVVEQECIYQDLDDIDFISRHVFYRKDQKVLGYLRVFYKPDEENTVQMGRVLTLKHETGLGGKLLLAGIEEVREKMPCRKIVLPAQSHAIGYYERYGFHIVSDEFIEDEIPHVWMEREL
ncbi:MAG: GNAT family N-acetyltransferase [Eubacteriales bacterium]|nr:GNAT family N-acetyltransferase [Eubacteriales bacterium]